MGGKEKKESVGFSDQVIAVLRDKNGNVKYRYDSAEHKHKCMVNAGMAIVSGLLLADVGGTAFDYVAIGTGAVAADPTDVALGVEEARKAGTGTRVTITVANDTAQLVATFAAADGLAGTDNITEVGIFNAAAGVTMLMRQVFTAIPCDWDAGDTLEMTVKVQVKQGA